MDADVNFENTLDVKFENTLDVNVNIEKPLTINFDNVLKVEVEIKEKKICEVCEENTAEFLYCNIKMCEDCIKFKDISQKIGEKNRIKKLEIHYKKLMEKSNQ